VSSASIWEISSKSSLGKLEIPPVFLHELKSQGFLESQVTWKHCPEIKTLPPIHTDPFDGLLIAQAKLESLTFLTVDKKCSKLGYLMDVTIR
jgi:PIN domain nuclease of toxin-antitoxin system